MLNNGRKKVSARINACRTVCNVHILSHLFCLLGRMLSGTHRGIRHPKISENFGQMRF